MIHEADDQSIQDILDIHIKGTLYGFRYLIPAIKETVGTDGPTGSIVVNSSCMGESTIGPKSNRNGIYAASKAFLNNVVKTTAVENAPLKMHHESVSLVSWQVW